MNRIAIIPARGGSKRIPRKNIRPFLGKPIIAYAIETALASGQFTEVMVSTDDEEIAEISRRYGARIPFLRSASNSDDTATTVEVLAEVLGHYATVGPAFVAACCLYPTSPFVTPDLLLRGHELFESKAYDCVFPVVRYGYPIQRSVTLDSRNRMHLRYPEFKHTRSQDLEPAYHDAGMFYWFRPVPVLDRQTLWTDNTGCIEVAESRAQDIDTEEDWRIAELKYRLLHHE